MNSPEEGLNMLLGANVLKEIQNYDSNEEFAVRMDLYLKQQLLHGNFTKFLIDSLTRIHNSETRTNHFEKLNEDEKNKNQLLNYIKSQDVSDLEDVRNKYTYI